MFALKRDKETRNRLFPALAFMVGAILLILVLGKIDQPAKDWLSLERDLVLNGEIWRLITAHFVHFNFDHSKMNSLGIILCCVILIDVIEIRALCEVFIACGLAVGLGVFFLMPSIDSYVGFSGLLHGIFSWGLLHLFSLRAYTYAILANTVLWGKILWEGLFGPVPGAEHAVGGVILIESHLYGAIGGVGVWIRQRKIGRNLAKHLRLF